MAIRQRTRNLVGYGLDNALQSLAPLPIIANREPTFDDTAPIGTLWVYPAQSGLWILNGFLLGSPIWSNLSGGDGSFANLIVYDTTNLFGDTNIAATTVYGPKTVDIGTGAGIANTINIGSSASTTTISGALNITPGTNTVNIGADASAAAINIGTGAAVVKTIAIGGTGANVITIGNTQTAGSVSIGAAMTTGTINIGGTGLQTGTVTIAGGTGAQTVNVATGGTGVKTVHIADGAVANVVTLGSTTGAASTTIKAGTLGITLTAPFVALPGPVYIYTGAGAPSNGLALHVGDLYINTTAASASTRMYIATAASTWTNVTCAA